jgi:uncharacterized protein YjdB
MSTPFNLNLQIGQTARLVAIPMFNGQDGGILPGPVTWSHNCPPANATVELTPTSNNDCTLRVTAVMIGSSTSFSVTAVSGGLTATCVVTVGQLANDMRINAFILP